MVKASPVSTTAKRRIGDGLSTCRIHPLIGVKPHTHTHTRARTHTHTHTQLNRFTALFPGPPGWGSARRNPLLDFMVQGKITEANTPTTRLGATPSGLITDPPPLSLHFTPDALLAATLPIYPGLGQAANMLACIPSGFRLLRRTPSLEIAPTTLAQTTRQTTKILCVVTCLHSRKRNIFHPMTVNFDLWPWPSSSTWICLRWTMTPNVKDHLVQVIVQTQTHTHTPDHCFTWTIKVEIWL